MYRKKKWFAVALLLLALTRRAINGMDTGSTCESVDDAVGEIVRATTPEVQLEVTTSIIQSIAPAVLERIAPELREAGPDSSLEVVYEELAEEFGRKTSATGFNDFIGAVNEISVAKAEACKGSSDLTRNDVSRLVQQFNDAFGVRNKDLTNIRSIYGKLLCIDEGGPSAARKRRQDEFDLCPAREDCECPEGGLESGEFFCTCEFFECLDPDDVLKPIFGFTDFDPDGDQCLAFIVDTTGSMRREIATARRIVNEFLLREEELGALGCYILVPFNDIDDTRDSSEESVGPIQIADPHLIEDIKAFREAVQALRGRGGGDTPEYALYGMKQALEATGEDEFGEYDLMVRGSQMVVITDAPSKQPELTDEVIRLANDAGVCIHFFVDAAPPRYDPTNDGIYPRIASETFGSVTKPFSNWDLARFVETYEANPCTYLSESRRKRQAPVSYSSDSCANFLVSQLAVLIKLSIDASTGSVVTITRPDGTISTVNVAAGNFAVFSERLPPSGRWSACVNSGTIRLSHTETTSFDTSFFYLSDGSTDISTTLPSACSPGKIVIVSSQVMDIKSAKLNVIDTTGSVVKDLNLTQCSGSLVSDSVYFVLGEFSYQLVGKDTGDISFTYNTRKNATFTVNERELGRIFTLTGTSRVEMEPYEFVTVTYTFRSNAPYVSQFAFRAQRLSGFATRVLTRQAQLSPGESVAIEVLVRRSSSRINRGTLHSLTITASNDCIDFTASTTLYIRELATLPPVTTVSASPGSDPDATVAPAVPNECGCVKGTCVTTRRRGRVIRRCVCPTHFRGSKCQIDTRPVTFPPPTSPTTTTAPPLTTTTLPPPTTPEPETVLTICQFGGGRRLNVTYVESRALLDVLYLSEGSTDASSTAPSACSYGRMVVVSKSDGIYRLTLKLVNSSGLTAMELPLTKCVGSSFISLPISFPVGSYTYKLVGTDSGGHFLFENAIEKTVSFDDRKHSINDTKLEGIVIELSATAHLIAFDFQVIIPTSSPSLFTFTNSLTSGLEVNVKPYQKLVTPGSDRVHVTVGIRATDPSLRSGSLHEFTVFTSNGCSRHATVFGVRIR